VPVLFLGPSVPLGPWFYSLFGGLGAIQSVVSTVWILLPLSLDTLSSLPALVWAWVWWIRPVEHHNLWNLQRFTWRNLRFFYLSTKLLLTRDDWQRLSSTFYAMLPPNHYNNNPANWALCNTIEHVILIVCRFFSLLIPYWKPSHYEVLKKRKQGHGGNWHRWKSSGESPELGTRKN